MKQCAKCKEHKPFYDFNKNARYKDGHQSYCRACMAVAAKECYWRYPQRHRVRASKWAKDNRDTVRERDRVYREENIVRVRQWDRDRYCRDKLKRLVYAKKYALGHQEQHNKASREWAIRNKDNRRAHSMARRAARINALPLWADLDAIQIIYTEARGLEIETGEKLHVDHIVPLRSNIVCGLHCEANLAILNAADNIRKGNRVWPDMP